MLDIGVTYDTPPEKIDQAVAILKELLKDHEGMRPSDPPRVHFYDFAASSLTLRVIYWYYPGDWWPYMEFTERLNRSILQRFNEAGIEFAFPTQTIHLAGTDDKR